MEKSKKELESIVTSQKEQLNRYEARLKDVVTAYKGLLKEKEALESSLSALNSAKEETEPRHSSSPEKENSLKNDTSTVFDKISSNESSPRRTSQNVDLQAQIATLMNSLATLSAEKSRMEASFQADKKKLRNDLAKKDEKISGYQVKVKELEKKNTVDVENVKSKVIIERHEREKETNNHMIMIRELQKLYADERHLKENLEMQLNDLKSQISSSSGGSSNKLKELTVELKDAKEKLKQYENNSKDTALVTYQENTNLMQQLQNEMHHMKQQHANAIRAEQKRALVAEEHSKNLSAFHENRVANLEARLAELSNTVGTYDRLRQQDQENIHKLKEKISKFANNTEHFEQKLPITQKHDVQSIFDEILQLKKILLVENSRSTNPIDISKIFNSNGNDHMQCLEDYRKLKEEIENLTQENLNLTEGSNEQRKAVKTLKEKIIVLNRNIEEQEAELKIQNERLVQAVKTEKSKWKVTLTTLENEYRGKLNEMEQQLQKQRIRSVQLLDEKENEIKALKTSFELCMPQSFSRQDSFNSEEMDKTRKTSASHIQLVLNSSSIGNNSGATGIENCHMLHYANEIARKDVEISGLRKSKYIAETALRQALQDKVTTQQELHERISDLELEVDRLERCKTREGANLEYLKNVFISFLSTSNIDGKRHMINAISAVLQFTSAETQAINTILFNMKPNRFSK